MITKPRYLDAVRGILDHLESTQLPAVERAADVIIESLNSGGAVFCSSVGHGIEGDFINRAGGLAVVQHFGYSVNVNSPVADCRRSHSRPEPFDGEFENVRFALRAGNVRAGDVMLMGSVSGKNRGPIELAIACREIGVKTIGFTSLTYAAEVESLHPSGKKLCDAVDVVIDNGAPYGDAAVQVPGFPHKTCPVSGVSMDISGWLVWERVIAKMTEAGNPPTCFKSLNQEGGKEYYDSMKAQFNERGY